MREVGESVVAITVCLVNTAHCCPDMDAMETSSEDLEENRLESYDSSAHLRLDLEHTLSIYALATEERILRRSGDVAPHQQLD